MSNAAIRKSDGRAYEYAAIDSIRIRRYRAIASFVAGALLGSAIWAVSRVATGHAEPWDATGYYYLGCLIGAGFLSTLVYSRSCVYGTLGVYLGQVAYMTLSALPGDPIILPAFLSVAIFGLLPAFFGSLIAFGICKLLPLSRQRIE